MKNENFRLLIMAHMIFLLCMTLLLVGQFYESHQQYERAKEDYREYKAEYDKYNCDEGGTEWIGESTLRINWTEFLHCSTL